MYCFGHKEMHWA